MMIQNKSFSYIKMSPATKDRQNCLLIAHTEIIIHYIRRLKGAVVSKEYNTYIPKISEGSDLCLYIVGQSGTV